MKVNWDIERLRGIAILFVLIHHLPHVTGTGYGRFYHWFNPWTGVDLFFVISGFIVTKTFLESRQSLGTFFIRRIFRIVPLALAWVLIPLGLSLWLPGLPATKELAYDLLTVSTATFNLADAFGIHHGVLAPYWSLSIEQQFYLVLPFLLFLRNRTAVLIAAIAFITFALRPAMIYAGFDANVQHKFSLLKFDTLAAGVLLYFFPPKLNFNRWTLVVLCAAVGVLPAVIAPEFHVRRYMYALPLITLASASLVAAAAQNKNRFPRFLDWFGSRSYALYLVHWPAIWFAGGSVWRFAAIVFCLAELSHRLIERPMISVGKMLASGRVSEPAPAPAS